MSDDYLWDGSGSPDPEVERLERLLGRLRHNRPAPEFSMPIRRFPAGPLRTLVPRLAAAAVVLLIAAGAWQATRPPKAAWDVARLEGTPEVGAARISTTARLGVGEWLETDSSSRARIAVGVIGEVVVEPGTRIRLVRAQPTDHRLELARGTIHATIWAPPRLFYVQTPSALAVDLGCRYTLRVDGQGVGLLRVTYGWVAFEQRVENRIRESFVPAGAMCATRPRSGPGTPYFEDASEAFRSALAHLDQSGVSGGVGGGVPGGISGGVSGGIQGGVKGGVSGGVAGGVEASATLRANALETVLTEARKRDALTLWHLLARTSDSERTRVFDRLAQLVPPPAGVTREGVLHREQRMLDLWWNELGLGNTSWWRLWKGPWSTKSR